MFRACKSREKPGERKISTRWTVGSLSNRTRSYLAIISLMRSAELRREVQQHGTTVSFVSCSSSFVLLSSFLSLSVLAAGHYGNRDIPSRSRRTSAEISGLTMILNERCWEDTHATGFNEGRLSRKRKPFVIVEKVEAALRKSTVLI